MTQLSSHNKFSHNLFRDCSLVGILTLVVMVFSGILGVALVHVINQAGYHYAVSSFGELARSLHPSGISLPTLFTRTSQALRPLPGLSPFRHSSNSCSAKRLVRFPLCGRLFHGEFSRQISVQSSCVVRYLICHSPGWGSFSLSRMTPAPS